MGRRASCGPWLAWNPPLPGHAPTTAPGASQKASGRLFLARGRKSEQSTFRARTGPSKFQVRPGPVED